MKIADDDKLYELLDQWHDEDEYDNILEKIFEIPRQQWSNKLWFRVISAYNNKEQFGDASKELQQMRPFCVEPGDIAKWYYMYAYMFYANDKEVLASWYLKEGLKHNAGHEACLELKEECDEYIERHMDIVKEMLERAAECIEKRQIEVLEKDELKACAGGEFAALLSFPACLRMVPGIPKCMGLDIFYKCETEEAKEETREFLKQYFGIVDTESVKQAWGRYRSASDYVDFTGFWDGKPSFDIRQLNEDGLSAFESAKFFAELFRNYVKDTGLYAVDISERMTLLRMAFACDILSNTDYCSAMLVLEDIAKEHYHSWKEYAIAAFCGNAYTVYSDTHMDLKQTVQYMNKILSVLPYMDWFYYQWEN